MEVYIMALFGKINDTKLKNALSELKVWCENHRGYVNVIFSEQVTMEEKITKLFWCVKEVLTSQINVVDGYNELYTFVNDYFDNLDVQNEINNKIDEMIKDGTLEEIISDKLFSQLDVESLHKTLNKGNKKIVFIGDSIANGWGWWTNDTPMTDDNRGVYSLMKKNYPDNEYSIYARNSAYLSSEMDNVNNIYTQLQQITTIPDMVFLICGINDINGVFQRRDKEPDYFGFDVSFFSEYIHDKWDTTLNALCSTISYIKNKNNNCLIYYVIPPTTLSNNQMFYGAFKNLIFIAQQYGCRIVNGQSIVRNLSMSYNTPFLYDRIHPNEKGYNELFKLVMQSDFQMNQIVDSEGNIRCVSGDMIAEANVQSIINKCVDFVNSFAPKLNKEYYNDDLVVTLNNEISLMKIKHSYNNNYFFKFIFTSTNDMEIELMYHAVNSRAYLIGIRNYNTNMSIDTVPSSIDDITEIGRAHV